MLGGGGGVAGGHSAVPVNREVKMVAAKGKSLLATSARITGSECSHADLLGVIRAESQVCSEKSQIQKEIQIHKNNQHQVVAGTNFRLVLKIRRKTGSGCSDNLEQVIFSKKSGDFPLKKEFQCEMFSWFREHWH